MKRILTAAVVVIVLMVVPGVGQTGIDTHTVEGITSCEKRNWPVGDPICHGYALAMAHQYFQDHPEYFEPRPIQTATTATFNGGSAQPLPCARYQHFAAAHVEGCGTNMASCAREVPDSCVDDVHWTTEREWHDVLDRLRNLEAKSEKAKP